MPLKFVNGLRREVFKVLHKFLPARNIIVEPYLTVLMNAEINLC
jgi:hypothetical protein